jgi:hypothetical protein
MNAGNQPNSFTRAAHTVESALLAIVVRHYGLELRQKDRDDTPEPPLNTQGGLGRARPKQPPGRTGKRNDQATSRSFWASASDCNFFSDWFSIWRIRSRVTLNVRPTSSSVRGCSPPSP